MCSVGRAARRRLVVLLVMLVGLVAWALLSEPRAGLGGPGWSRLPDLPTGRGELAGAVLEVDGRTFLAVVGGFTGPGRPTDEVTLFSPRTRTWRPGPPLPEPRHHAAAAGLDGSLYVAGGTAGVTTWEPERTVWRLPPGADAWEAIDPLPEGRWGHRLVALEGRLYVIGGEGGTGTVLVFDPGQGWSRGAPLPVPRDHLGTAVMEGEIWAIAGRDDRIRARVDVYDPAADAWREGPPLPVPTSGAAVGVVDGRIYVVGGEDPALTGGIVSEAWVLEGDRSDWAEAPPPPLYVHGAAEAVLEGRLVIAGGSSRQGALSPLSWTRAVQVFDPLPPGG